MNRTSISFFKGTHGVYLERPMDSITAVGGVDVAPVATTATHSRRSTSTVVYPVACSLPVVASSSAAPAVAVDENSDLHRRRAHLISRLTLAGVTDIPALVATIAVTSISSSFRLISPSESAAHDVDLVTLVRRSWFGELHRDASGAPSSVKFRFPLLSVTPAAPPLVTSEVSTTSPSSPAPRNREHGTVVCVVHRSGYVALHTTACIEDIGPIAQYVHNQLRPHVCAPGAGSEVEHSIASAVPEGLSLHHFGADITLPAALLLLVSQQQNIGAATPASHKHHHRAATTTSATAAAAGLPVRKLREACHRLWPSPLATTHQHHQPQHHAAAGVGQQKTTDTREKERNGASGGRHSKRQREEDDATSVTDAPGGGPPKSSGAQRRGALLRHTSKSVSMPPSSASSLFGEDDLTANENMEYMTFGASVAPTGRGNWMNGDDAPPHQDIGLNRNHSAKSGVHGDYDGDDNGAMLTALFQQHSAMLSISDAFQFASVLDTTATDADGGDHDRRVALFGHAVCQPTGSSAAIVSQQPGDQILSTEYKDRYHVTVLPSREEHKELRLLFTPLHPDGWLEQQQQQATGGSNVAASRARNGRNGDKLSSSTHHNEVTLSFSHTGHVKVVRAAALPLVASVLQYAVMPLLLDVLVLGG